MDKERRDAIIKASPETEALYDKLTEESTKNLLILTIQAGLYFLLLVITITFKT